MLVSLIALVIQHLISIVFLTPLSPMLEFFFFFLATWRVSSLILDKAIKSLMQLNPIIQISVFRAVKILSGNLNVVRILIA